MTTTADDGAVILPRRADFWKACGLVLGLLSMTVSATWVMADIATLKSAIADSRARGDDLRRRVTDLELMRINFAKLEEQLKGQSEILREIREELRKKS